MCVFQGAVYDGLIFIKDTTRSFGLEFTFENGNISASSAKFSTVNAWRMEAATRPCSTPPGE